MQRIVFATGNAGKVREMRAMLGSAVELVLQAELGIEAAEETGQTFTENALLKARHAAAKSGLPALADDSGIEVDALNGAPGVYSARYAGADASDTDNLNKLLDDMREQENRAARFRCVLAWVRSVDDPNPVIAQASWEGRIAHEPSGNGGFGYDPVFIDAASGVCSAELSAAEKNACSHRGKALLVLQQMLAGII
ncbi:MAG: RdgB/HAM1 family non-canonical purine NTP pyrophosphatase [Gammaproteobacteria bacterium]|nr:RdgB/HAM1 family non-canonical purine NTP pyrophosphatase [Gammaproteobacteria bacterium]MCP4089939.1 RdgB/HAM1 family non-canonical purine NTP pyrophosphatase [Gammaproteobacteria bacterium]MCP4276270.1 RdgB/HAM1 family non-canonical purine NTP pyrophosphatase [Gammaproteobacteria bacterium]MCP4831265.1 RdgB/HAM1 family non-canonical purine NTP pyrophosphatase [Gammaproteobacteria bacterium]MCP4928748.1 RdgB/HAM1 family non-canonical purine NTP pyrophosphatase [Gammaproteobacteria bacterium